MKTKNEKIIEKMKKQVKFLKKQPETIIVNSKNCASCVGCIGLT